ncbi:hypothetical protein AXA44_24565 [Rhodococcus sp. SC4]|nr:hypothetical protein AXA44_24565 [Rhodococcus sp. SC4]
MCFKFVDSFASPLLCTKSFRFEVLAGGVGVGVFVVAESDGDAVGGAWGGPVGEFASEVLTHLADGQGCEVGEDLSAGGGGSSSRARRRWSVPISSWPSRAVWRRLPSRTFFVLAGGRDVPDRRGGARRG